MKAPWGTGGAHNIPSAAAGHPWYRPLSPKELLGCADGVRSIWVNESLFARVEEPAVACDSLRPPGMEEMGWESAISVAELQARSLGQSPHAVEH